MVGKVVAKRDKATMAAALQTIHRRNQLTLLAIYLRKFERYSKQRQERTHLKRCAVLLKHQGIRRTVTTYFLRWLSSTQRQTSVRAGNRELSKIVVLPRNKDYMNLGVRYLTRWRLWIRQLRQRKATNIALIQTKANEGFARHSFFHWRIFVLDSQKEKLHDKVEELDKRNKSLQHSADLLQNELEKYKEEIQDMHNTMQRAVEAIEDSENHQHPRNIIELKKKAEELAHSGNDLPLRLLSACDAAVQQLKALRDGVVRLEREHGAWRCTDEERRRLIDELRAHDERWEAPTRRPPRLATTHQSKTFEGGDWAAALERHPEELRRAVVEDAADACHVDPDCITKVRLAPDRPVADFDVEHDAARRPDDIAQRVSAFPFRGVRRVLRRRAAPKEGVDLLAEKLHERDEAAALLRTAMEEAAKALESGAVPDASQKQKAEEMARNGNALPLRLLSDCEAAARAMDRVRKALPEDAVGLGDSLEAIASAVHQHVQELNATEKELKTNLRDCDALNVFLLDFLREGAEQISQLANHEGLSEPASLRSAMEDKSLPRPLPPYDVFFSSVLNASHAGVESKALLDQLSPKQSPVTVTVLEAFHGSLSRLEKTLVKDEDLHPEQRETTEKQEERHELLVDAANKALDVLRSWNKENADGDFSTPISDIAIQEDSDVEHSEERKIVTELRSASINAARTLASLRTILAGDTSSIICPSSVSHVSSSEQLSVPKRPRVESHEELIDAVQQLRGRLSDASAAYQRIHDELRQYAPDSPISARHVSFDSPNSSKNVRLPPRKLQQADRVVRAVQDRINGKGREVRDLRAAMRNSILALGGGGGGAEESESEDDFDVGRSAEKSNVIGQRLTSLCKETGDAIDDTRTALGMPTGAKLRLAEMLPSIKERMNELEVVRHESTALAEEMRQALGDDSLSVSATSPHRSLKPKKKPVALVLGESVMRCGTVRLSPQLTQRNLASPPRDELLSMHPNEMIQKLRRDVQEKCAEARNLRAVCGTLVDILDGTCKEEVKAEGEKMDERERPLKTTESLVPLLLTQTEDLKRALRTAAPLFKDEPEVNGSVGNRLTKLTTMVESLRLSNAALSDDSERRMRQSAHLLQDFTAEGERLRSFNAALQSKLEAYQQKSAFNTKQLLDLVELRRRFTHWQQFTSMLMRSRLADDVVRRQNEQNNLAHHLSAALRALPKAGSTSHTSAYGEIDKNDETQTGELSLLQQSYSGTLEEFMQHRLLSARQWARGVAQLLAALRSDATEIRRAVTVDFSTSLRSACASAIAAIDELAIDIRMEVEVLRRRALDRETLARRNVQLSAEVNKLQQQTEKAQRHIDAQDNRIVRLQREKRDLLLNETINGMDAPSSTVTPFSDADAERKMIEGAKRLALETINAMAGQEVAVVMGEVSELTVEMYHRTTAALEEAVEECGVSTARTSARLEELRGMCTLKNDIIARLPKLLRTPYLEANQSLNDL